MKRILTLLAAVAICAGSYAYDFEEGGIYYDITSSKEKTVNVTYKDTNYNSYSGNVVIPSNVIYNGATYSVTSIGDGAFYKCLSLASVTIPNSVTSMGDWVFYFCSALTSVTIPNCVTSIGYSAFYYCSRLTSITIPSSVTSIGDLAFYHCDRLTSVTIPSSVMSIGEYAFWNCSSLSSVTIDNSVKSIGNGAFHSCSSLSSVTIGNSVTSIGERAFFGCNSLASITIPHSVTNIGEYAFYYCKALTSISNRAKNPQSISGSVFSDYGTLHVIKGYKDVYSNASYWSNFTIIDDLEYEVNAIGPIHLQANNNDIVYNLNGTKEGTYNLPAGIYIKNGKKVVMK